MRELSFAEVLDAGMPARIELAYVGYEYRPLFGDVAVHIPPTGESAVGTTHRVPRKGWHHEPGCSCRYCKSQGRDRASRRAERGGLATPFRPAGVARAAQPERATPGTPGPVTT
jgi:hypothetical protein